MIYRSQDWQNRYYKLLEEQTKDKKTFGELLHLLHGVDNSVEVSFASKLIATVCLEELIWDKCVLKNLGFDKEWNKANGLCYRERIKVAMKIYEGVKIGMVVLLIQKKGRGVLKSLMRFCRNIRIG